MYDLRSTIFLTSKIVHRTSPVDWHLFFNIQIVNSSDATSDQFTSDYFIITVQL